MRRHTPNMEGRTAKYLMDRGVSDFGGPNRGGRGYGHGGKHYPDRDNPRGSFNFTMNKSRTIQRKSKNPFLTRIDESGDVIMDGEKPTHSRAFTSHPPRSRGGKRHVWRNLSKDDQGQGRSRHNFGPTWHKVLIYDGAQHSRDFILTALRNASRTPFQPVAYTPLGSNVVFFVEDRPSAEAIAECSGRITAPDTSKIEFKVDSCPTPPTLALDDNCVEKMREVLAYRYNPSPPSLSLVAFHESPELILDYYLPLFRPSVMEKILTILESTLPSLIYLDISNNKLTTLDNFRKLGKLCPNLRGLNIKKNRLRDITQLERLQGLELQELMLEGNPLCDRLKERPRYVSAVRKYFPKIVELDGVHEPPVISFDLEEPTRIPTTKQSFFCNEEAKKVVLTFVEQYILIYDSENRNPLMDAYHDSAIMSMHSSYLKQNVSTDNPMNKLSTYLADGRNLLRLNPSEKTRRSKLVHDGKVNIVAFLNKLPKTTHDLSSFIIDMPLAVEAFITFTLSGVFKERGDRPTAIRAFQRTFNLVPQNQGFCIVNELLYITNATYSQGKAAFKLSVTAPTPSTSPVSYVQQVATVGTSQSLLPLMSTVPSPSEADRKAQMTTMFAQQSGMNDEWSRKCLEENEWNYEKSAFVFTELQKAGHIPPEAFVKTT